MQYWEEFQTKWGFDDGDQVPAEAWTARKVYVRAINHLAEQLGSKYRVAAWDRSGCHNPLFIVTISKEEAWKYGPKGLDDGSCSEFEILEETDKALERAINGAHDLNLDQYVECKITIDEKKLKKALK